MKKHWTIYFLIFVLCLVLSGCSATNTVQKISDHKWKIEFISDLDGNIVETNLGQSGLTDKKYEITLSFSEDDSFVLSDKINNQEWRGNYTIEKVDSSYKLDLHCEETETIITGVYGIREYDDKTKIPSITLQAEERILSFIATE